MKQISITKSIVGNLHLRASRDWITTGHWAIRRDWARVGKGLHLQEMEPREISTLESILQSVARNCSERLEPTIHLREQTATDARGTETLLLRKLVRAATRGDDVHVRDDYFAQIARKPGGFIWCGTDPLEPVVITPERKPPTRDQIVAILMPYRV